MRGLRLMLIATCLASQPAAAAAQAGPAPGPAEAAAEFAANRNLIRQLTAQRASLDSKLVRLRGELQDLLERQRRCRETPSACPPASVQEHMPPMVGMAPGHAPAPVPQVSVAELMQQRAAIAQLRAGIRSRTELVGRFERRIAALRAQ